jgi:TfoX/Sxy family transcriptional regulator of competence genes
MAYDEGLAQRIRQAVAGEPGVGEKRMFGGLAFLVHGNMAVSASGQGGMLLRIDPADAEDLTGQPHVSRFRMRGRDMHGWLHVEPGAYDSDEALTGWVERGLAYARSLPEKAAR